MAPAFAATDSERSVTKQDGRHNHPRRTPLLSRVMSLPTNCRGVIYGPRFRYPVVMSLPTNCRGGIYGPRFRGDGQ